MVREQIAVREVSGLAGEGWGMSSGIALEAGGEGGRTERGDD